MLFVGTSIIHPSTEGVFLLCNILDLLIYSRKIAAHGSWRIHERLVITYASYRLTLFAFRVKHISLLREHFAIVGQYPRAPPYFNSCSHEVSDHFLFLFR